LIRAWSPDVISEENFRKIKLNPSIGKYRTCIEGVGIIQFTNGRTENSKLFSSDFSHWNEAGAKSRSIHPCENVDWAKMRFWSGRVSRYIRNKCSVGKIGSASIFKSAYSNLDNGVSIFYGGNIYTKDNIDIGK